MLNAVFVLFTQKAVLTNVSIPYHFVDCETNSNPFFNKKEIVGTCSLDEFLVLYVFVCLNVSFFVGLFVCLFVCFPPSMAA